MSQTRSPIDLLANALFVGAGLLLGYALLAWLLALPRFDLRHLEIRGALKHVDANQIQLVSRRTLRGNFFTADLDELRTAFEKLPWVSEARVTRSWPDRLIVELEEHTPLAVWNTQHLISQKGRVFAAHVEQPLPHLSGNDEHAAEASQAYLAFAAHLAPLGMSIERLSLSARKAWRLHTRNGLEIALGRNDAESRLARFVSAWPRLLERLGAAPVYADLRYADGFALRLSPIPNTPPRAEP